MQRLRIALGNKPSVSLNMIPVLESKYQLVDTLSQQTTADSVDVVIPLCLQDYDLLRTNPSLAVKAIFPDPVTVALCHDKLIFREWFKGRFTASYLPAQDCTTPLVIAKPRQGEWGHNTYLVETSNHAALAAVQADPAMYIENYITGQREYSMHILYNQGQLLYAALSTYDHNQPSYVQGVADQPAPTTIEICENIPQIFHDLLKALNYRGSANIDYKIDEFGQIRIFEFNPRIGGSIAYLTESYVNCYVDAVLRKN